MSKFIRLRPSLWKDDKLIPYGSPEAKAHDLAQYPVIFWIILHYMTLGIWSIVWLNGTHGRMPKIRRDDPSAGKANLCMLVPILNLYWIFFTNVRLCERINEQRAMRALPEKPLRGLAIASSVLLVAGAVLFGYPFELAPPSAYAVAGTKVCLLLWYGILEPIYLALVQHAVNELAIITYVESLADAAAEQNGDQ